MIKKINPKNRRNRNSNKIYFILFTIIITLFTFSTIVLAPPPSPHGISGFILLPSGAQVPLGTKYTINDSTLGLFIASQTSFPAPGYSGYYSNTLNGADGDNVAIMAWNNSYYGITNVILAGSMSGVNVTLNLSRSPEPTVNITLPNDNALRNDSTYFTVLSNITLFGSSATNCFAEISYSNNSVLSSYNSQPKIISLGSLSLGFSSVITWNISGIAVGSSNVTVNFTCDSMFGIKFESLNFTDTILNITIQDTTPPNITLISPFNNSKTMNSSIIFSYNVSDINNVLNCSLFINGTFKQINDTITKYTTLFFNETINEGINIWQITCNDTYGNKGFSKNFTLTKDTRTRTIYPEISTYTQGFTARFLGYNWTQNSNITLNITKSNGISILQTSLSINDLLNTTFWINYSDPLGQYNITAYERNYTFYNASSNFMVSQRTQAIFTDNNIYNYYENLTLSGFNFTINGTINVRFFHNTSNATAYIKNATSNFSGNFIEQWNVSNYCDGVYGATVKDLNYTTYEEIIYFNITGGLPCLNIGNKISQITNVLIEDIFSAPIDEINLLATTTTHLDCNFSVYDEDNISDIVLTNATLFYYLNKSTDSDNNNTHYTNSSCTRYWNNSVDTVNFTCGFDVYYYANNGTWICNATALDTQDRAVSSNDSTKIMELFALNITNVIDFGILPTGDISGEVTAVVTNFGNVMIDIGIDAYAVNDGDGMAMNCTKNNISLSDLRYSQFGGAPFNLMTPITDLMVTLPTFNLQKQSDNSLSQKNIYWRVTATPLSLGDCSGIIVVTAR